MKQDVIDAGVAAVQEAEKAALAEQLGVAYDAGMADAPKPEGGGLSQADVDAAVAAQKAIDDKAMADAQALADGKMADLQKALEDMTAKEQLEEAAVADVQAKVEQVQAAFDAIKAILLPPKQ